MKILVAEQIADAGVEILRAEGHDVDVRPGLARADLLDIIDGYDGLIIRSATKADAELIERASLMKVIGRAGTGVDNVDIDAATRAGVLVVNAPQSNSLSTAEHAMALLLAQARNIAPADASTRAGKWERSRFAGVELHGKTLAVLGLGRIGSLVAQRALAFGMKIIAYDPYVSAQRASQMGVELLPLDEALARADFLTIHMAKTSETAAMLGERELALMKPTARIINAARGGMVDEQALADAVSSGRLAGAGIDVFSEEPPKSSPLFAVEQILVTPHLSASTAEAQDKAGVTIAEQVSLALRGDIAQYAVNVDLGREMSAEVRPFLGLAERLGRIFTGLSGAGFHAVRVTYRGAIADQDTRVLTLSALRGLLSGIVDEAVTFVNAPLLAEERGIVVNEERAGAAGESYVNEIEIASDNGVAVAGTVFGKGAIERLTQVYDFHLDMPPAPFMVFLRYDDRPGVIGAIGTILGRTSVNIADMRVGRQELGGEALMCLTVDQPIGDATMAALVEGSGAKEARLVVLP